jgi:hypothetical protein
VRSFASGNKLFFPLFFTETARQSLGLAEHGALPAGEAHVAGQHELVTDAARAAANLGDAYDWRGREAQHKIAPKAERLRPFGCLGHVEMGNEKIGIRRLEHNDLHGRVRFELSH